jgi:hypothetical protein
MRVRAIFVLLLSTMLVGCRTQPQAKANQQEQRVSHDLSMDEERGGHTLKRHVERTDEQLRERLQKEPSISAASSFKDRQTAERAVGTSLQDNVGKIRSWIQRGARRPNLVLDYSDPNDSLGRVLYRGAMGSVPCDHAIVVLKSDGAQDYFVLTSYPECRP